MIFPRLDNQRFCGLKVNIQGNLPRVVKKKFPPYSKIIDYPREKRLQKTAHLHTRVNKLLKFLKDDELYFSFFRPSSWVKGFTLLEIYSLSDTHVHDFPRMRLSKARPTIPLECGIFLPFARENVNHKFPPFRDKQSILHVFPSLYSFSSVSSRSLAVTISRLHLLSSSPPMLRLHFALKAPIFPLDSTPRYFPFRGIPPLFRKGENPFPLLFTRPVIP